jgi:hypothetical protein
MLPPGSENSSAFFGDIPIGLVLAVDKNRRRVSRMLSPISMPSAQLQQIQQMNAQAQVVASQSASAAQPASLKPDTVSVSPQGQAASIGHDGDGDGH